MYSGITSGLFQVTSVEKRTDLTSYTIQLNESLLVNLVIGASIAVDGVCQTVVSINDNLVTFHAMKETLACTTLSSLEVGRWVSIERSLRYGDEVGGHEVAGHVIGTAKIISTLSTGETRTLTLACPVDWMKFILPKGFIAVDGSSLTVGEVDPKKGTFVLHLIPETLRQTHLGHKRVGELVNIELDHRTQAIVTTVERVLSQQNVSSTH